MSTSDHDGDSSEAPDRDHAASEPSDRDHSASEASDRDRSSSGVSDPLDESVDGYRRNRNDVGVRNRVLVTPSVICSHIVADRIADAVEGAVSTPHDHGCAQIGADHDQTERTLRHLAQNPNIAGTTVVGLGCEHLQSDSFAELIEADGVPVRETAIQDAGGTDACFDEGVELTAELEAQATDADRESVTLEDVTIGVVASDLSESTRNVAAPLVGGAVDTLLEAGGRVLVAGSERLVPHGKAATDRAKTDAVAADVADAIDARRDQPANARSVVRQAQTLPFESVVGEWGGAPISELVAYGDRPSVDDGLVVVDSPSRFEEAATALAAAGASIIVHVTDDGIPTGHPVVPVLKVTGNETTMDAVADDMDVDARSATSAELLETLRLVADGDSTAAETHGLTTFAISRVGPSM